MKDAADNPLGEREDRDPEADGVPGTQMTLPAIPESKRDRLATRRGQVERLSRLGMTVAQMSKVLRVGKNTITNDLQVIRSESRARAVNAEQYAEIGANLDALEAIEKQAMVDFSGAPPSSPARNSFLRTALQARLQRIELMQQSGIIPKAAEHVHMTGALEVLKMPADALERRKKEIIRILQEEGASKK